MLHGDLIIFVKDSRFHLDYLYLLYHTRLIIYRFLIVRPYLCIWDTIYMTLRIGIININIKLSNARMHTVV